MTVPPLNFAGHPRQMFTDEHRQRFNAEFGEWPGDDTVRGLMALMTEQTRLVFKYGFLEGVETFALRNRFTMSVTRVHASRASARQLIETFLEASKTMAGHPASK